MKVNLSVELSRPEERELMVKEISCRPFDPAVRSVHIGVAPSIGRYFRKKMIRGGDNYFHLRLELPKGSSYYHYFFNEDFSNARNDAQELIAPNDPWQRASIMMETPLFCPVQFWCGSPFVSLVREGLVEIRVVTQHNWIEEVGLLSGSSIVPLHIAFQRKSVQYWLVRIDAASLDKGFCVVVSGPSQTKYLHPDNNIQNFMDPSNLFRIGPAVRRNGTELMAKGFGAGYQIFPDRFYRESDGGSSGGSLHPWGGVPTLTGFFGGNIKGIIAKLAYIRDLGFDFIYLNPIAQANSPHRYDCTDYRTIDPLLGTDDDFGRMVEEAHRLGLKVILDISLNHCGIDFFAFRDILVNQERSKYVDWFEIERFPLIDGDSHYYSCWHGHRELPQFNMKNEAVIDHFLEIARYWPEKFGIDGWRLDVFTELPTTFLSLFVAETRKVNKDLVIIGETWQGDLHGICDRCGINGFTNYSFYLDGLVPFFEQENMSVSSFAERIMKWYVATPVATGRQSWNFLSNHDVPRFFSIIRNKRLYPLALALIYVLPGTPMLYYGEEICMEGLGDPMNRGCMDFASHPGESMLIRQITQLNRIRSAYRNLFQQGSIAISFIDEEYKVLALERSDDGKSVLCLFNFGPTSREFAMPYPSPGCGGCVNCKCSLHGQYVHLPAYSTAFVLQEGLSFTVIN